MKHSQTANPYASPMPEMPEPSSAALPASTVPPVSLTFRQKLIRQASSTVVVGAFFAIGYLAFRQLLERQWILGFVAASASLMCIPFVDHSSSVRQRLFASCLMPFGLAGMAMFVLLYFQMFHISWFERVFKDKSSGPVGLILCALPSWFAGRYLGWRVLTFLGWGESSNTAPRNIANSE